MVGGPEDEEDPAEETGNDLAKKYDEDHWMDTLYFKKERKKEWSVPSSATD